jgi:catechol 2,3-dioxygenase-like lactoylglutathione lyase family enzyme
MSNSRTPCLAHYGVTVAEPPVADDLLAIQAPGGQAAAGLEFLRWLGFEPLFTNLYPGIGRQWILRRGERGDAGYLERDLFTSFRAGGVDDAGSNIARIGDSIFRLPVDDPDATLVGLQEHGWAEPYMGVLGPLFRGPDAAVYELTPIAGDQAVDRTVSLWTDPDVLDDAVATWISTFGFELVEKDVNFHGVALATVLRRRGVGPITLQLLTPAAGTVLPPRVTDDIFAQQGYPHFRLGAPHKAAAQAVGETVFPDTGDVSYVMVAGAYLELIQLEPAN